MVTKPKRGRPKGTTKPLREDPGRYVIAYYIARMNLFARQPEPIKLARTLAQIHHAEIDDPQEFAAALAADRRVRVDMRPVKGHDNPKADNWRDRDAANAYAADFLIKVRALEKKLRDLVPSDTEDATSDQRDLYWLSLMVETWRLALTVDMWQSADDDFWARSEKVRAGLSELARANAAKARELAYFKKEIEHRFQLKISPLFNPFNFSYNAVRALSAAKALTPHRDFRVPELFSTTPFARFCACLAPPNIFGRGRKNASRTPDYPAVAPASRGGRGF
jgi:hypothetical protein